MSGGVSCGVWTRTWATNDSLISDVMMVLLPTPSAESVSDNSQQYSAVHTIADEKNADISSHGLRVLGVVVG